MGKMYVWLSDPLVMTLFIFISLWSLIWDGLALWKSARKKHKVWFVVLLLTNTVGLLEILYIGYFSKRKSKRSKKAKK